MPDLLIIGGAREALREKLRGPFTLFDLADINLAADGARFRYVLLNGSPGLPNETLDLLPKLELVSNYGVGYDGIDAAMAAERGIIVTHTPGVLDSDVAATAIMLMLACYRNLVRDDAWVRSGTWHEDGPPPLSRSAEGQKVGIVGMGRIGQEIARKLAVFDAAVSYHSRTPKDVPYPFEPDLVKLATDADCLIVITPGGAGTRHLVNREVMEALGPDGTLINVARGSVVDEAALTECLSSGALGWAGLDVFENEPHVPDALRTLSNVTLLPHSGSATIETGAMAQLVVDNLIDHLKVGTVRTPVPECALLASR